MRPTSQQYLNHRLFIPSGVATGVVIAAPGVIIPVAVASTTTASTAAVTASVRHDSKRSLKKETLEVVYVCLIRVAVLCNSVQSIG